MAMEQDSILELRKESAQCVVIQGCKNQLGIRIVGGRNIVSETESDFGIFIKEVLPNSLASEDGRLQRGDQLLEANGVSLIGVSNERAVQILKTSAATDSISLLVSRDPKAQSDFRRLSASLLRSPLDAVAAAAVTAATPRGDGGGRDPLPLATSTPRVADSMQPMPLQNGWSEQQSPVETEMDRETGQTGRTSPTEVHIRAVSTVTPADRNTQCSSTSSELTQISTTDISSHLDDSISEHTHHTRSTPEGRALVPNTDTRNVNPVETADTTPLLRQGTTESDEKSVALSDVVVSLGSSTLLEPAHPFSTPQNGTTCPLLGSLEGNDHAPPPLPLSPPPAAESPTADTPPPPVPSMLPPDMEEEGDQSTSVRPKKHQHGEAEVAMATAGSAIAEVVLRSRSPPEGESISSPPLSASLTTSPPLPDSSPSLLDSSPPLPTSSPPLTPTLHTITITKNTGLGVIISGGVSRPDGPHIIVDKIMSGMDAEKDGRMQKGDRILAVNGESFTSLTRERALTILTQLKIRQHVKSYTVTFERPGGLEDTPLGTSPPLTLPSPTRTTTTTIFDSETLPADFKSKTTVAPPTSMDTPDLYYRQSEEKEAEPKGHIPPWLSSRDAAWMKEGDGEEKSRATKLATPSRYLAKKDMSSIDKSKYDSLHKRLSMDPSARVKLAKMEWALKYMGYKMTPEQQKQLHETLDIDEEGKVVFADFVKLAQDMFAFTLEDAHMEANLVMALMQKDSMDIPAMPTKATSFEQLWREYSPMTSQLKGTSSHPSIPASLSPPVSPTRQFIPPRGEAELDHMRRQLHDFGQERDRLRLSGAGSETEKLQVEKERALQEVARLKMQLSHRDRELQLYRDVPPGSSGEAQALRKKLGLTEAAMSAARAKENQTTDKMHQLEAELSVYRGQQTDLTKSELRKRRAILDCQMKKEQKLTRLYLATTEKLMQFVENCHEVLTKAPEANRILYHAHGQGESVRRGNAVTGNPRPPPYLSKHAKVTTTTLAEEAKQTVAAVRKMLQTDVLPFGWEEAYTEDGHKYYINHETQTTSAVHPVTKVDPSPGSPLSTPSSRSRTVSQSSYSSHPVSVNQPT